MLLDSTDVRILLDDAFEGFLDAYAEFGGHRYYGFTVHDDPQNYKGPMFWSEGDCQFRFALTLEECFPKQVHLEMPVARLTFRDYDRLVDRREFIDIVVSDLSAFAPDETADERFRTHRHHAFIEVKHFGKGSSGHWRHAAIRKIPAVHADALRLARHVERGHCSVAAVLVIDDDCLFEDEMGNYEWPGSVLRLVATPRELERRGVSAADPARERPSQCPRCASADVVPVVIGMPTRELELAASRGELILGGCEIRGEERDPQWGCTACGWDDAPRIGLPAS